MILKGQVLAQWSTKGLFSIPLLLSHQFQVRVLVPSILTTYSFHPISPLLKKEKKKKNPWAFIYECRLGKYTVVGLNPDQGQGQEEANKVTRCKI